MVVGIGCQRERMWRRLVSLSAVALMVLAGVLVVTPGRAQAWSDVCERRSSASLQFSQPNGQRYDWGDVVTLEVRHHVDGSCNEVDIIVDNGQSDGRISVGHASFITMRVGIYRTADWTLYLRPRGGDDPLVLTTVRVEVDMPVLDPLPGDAENPVRVDINHDTVFERYMFARGVSTPNATVVVRPGLDLNLSGLEYLHIAPGVKILGGQARHQRAPRLFTLTRPSILFVIGSWGEEARSDNVRISGIRLDGGMTHWLTEGDEPTSAGIQVDSTVNVEIGDSELYGWNGSAISVVDPAQRMEYEDWSSVWLHDNWIHHNLHLNSGGCLGRGHGAGYGVVVSKGAYALIERSVFDWNRHAVASDGQANTGYQFNRNLVLKEGGQNSPCDSTHQIDVHGLDSCWPGHYNCGVAGHRFDVRFNTITYTKGNGLKVRGSPHGSMLAYDNVFSHTQKWGGTFSDGAMVDGPSGFFEDRNQLGVDPFDQLKQCDFDGDGTLDDFAATGVAWWYRSSERSRWVFLHTSDIPIGDVTVADVDGDGRCDTSSSDGVFSGGGPGIAGRATAVTGDVNFDGRSDITLVGQIGFSTLPQALTRENGGHDVRDVTAPAVGEFAAQAAVPGARVLSGDFDHNRRTDFAIVGPPGSTTVPMAFTVPDGTFRVTNLPIGTGWPSTAGGTVFAGDFNGDERTDLAVAGAPGATAVPVAFSNGDGGFRVTSVATGVQEFTAWASMPDARVIPGDFNRDGRMDLAVTGPAGFETVPVAFSNGDGSFRVTNVPMGEGWQTVRDFAGWAALPGAQVVSGDYNGDGRTDLAVTGVPGFVTVPVAFSDGTGAFRVTNTAIGGVEQFAAWASAPGATVLSADFNRDGHTDLAATGVPGWVTVPVAMGDGDGGFRVSNVAAGGIDQFAGWASAPDARTMTGDFNGDRRTDIALIGPPAWHTIPIAYAVGDGSFQVENREAGEFPSWAGTPRQSRP
jgi:hypothetical protein